MAQALRYVMKGFQFYSRSSANNKSVYKPRRSAIAFNSIVDHLMWRSQTYLLISRTHFQFYSRSSAVQVQGYCCDRYRAFNSIVDHLVCQEPVQFLGWCSFNSIVDHLLVPPCEPMVCLCRFQFYSRSSEKVVARHPLDRLDLSILQQIIVSYVKDRKVARTSIFQFYSRSSDIRRSMFLFVLMTIFQFYSRSSGLLSMARHLSHTLSILQQIIRLFQCPRGCQRGLLSILQQIILPPHSRRSCIKKTRLSILQQFIGYSQINSGGDKEDADFQFYSRSSEQRCI